jgi:UDP-N-acetyl-D-glucosamine dehydrogenase
MTKPFGFMPFFPSVGIGGHCIPIDPVYLSSASTNSGNMISLIDKSIEFNRSLPKIWAQRIFQRLKRDARSQIQVVGISYKAGVSDIRESASIRLIHELRKLGISVIWHDDLVKNWNEELSSPISKVDLGIITVRHPGVDFRTWTINKIPFLDLSPGLNRIFQD